MRERLEPVNQDRKLVGEVVQMLIDSGRMTKMEFARESGVGRATLYRVLNGNGEVEVATLRRLESSLSLPYDTLSFIATHDWRSLVEVGTDANLVRWVRRKMAISEAEGSEPNGQSSSGSNGQGVHDGGADQRRREQAKG